MADTLVMFNPQASTGQRFMSTAVQEEIAAAAAANALPGSVTQSMLAKGAVTAPAIAAGAVTSAALAGDSVTTAAIAPNAVTADQLAPNAVTTENLAPGVPDATDNAGNPIALTLVVCTVAQYSQIATPNANTLYFCTD